MDLSLSDEQQAVKDAFSQLFTKESPPEVVRATEPIGFSEELWRQMVHTGAVGISLPEDVGGGGAGMLEAALVAEQLGEHLAPVPLVEATVAARLLAASGEAGRAFLSALLEEGTLVTIAVRPPVAGTARLVPAGAVSPVMILFDGDELVAVGPAPELPRHVANLGAAPLADRPVDGPAAGPRTVLARGAEARRLHADALVEWRALTAMALAGVAARSLHLGVTYTKERQQFGVPIGSFQAVQHRLADVATAVDGARLLAYETAWAIDAGDPSAAGLASMAFVFASETAQDASAASLHFHGGYGFMLEYDIQLYFRRAKAWPLVLGDPGQELLELADLLYGAVAPATGR